MTTLDLQVAASTSDHLHYVDSNAVHGFNAIAVFHRIGDLLSAGVNYRYDCVARFIGVTIGQAATIDVAYMTFVAYSTYNSTIVNAQIDAEDVDNADIIDNDTEHDAVSWTTTKVDWSAIPSQTGETSYNTPEIKTVIQAIVNRAGWVSGNAINLRTPNNGSSSNARRDEYSYDSSTTKAPKLHIEYTAGGGASHRVFVT